MHIGQIWSDLEILMQTNEHIDQVVVGFYGDQFHAEMLETNYAQIYKIPKSISGNENEEMSRLLNQDEVNKVVFALNGSIACGPDGFTMHFFKCCWEIIGDDVTKLVRVFLLWTRDVKICYSYQLNIYTQETISTKLLRFKTNKS